MTETRRLLEELVEELGGNIGVNAFQIGIGDWSKHINGISGIRKQQEDNHYGILKVANHVAELAKALGYEWVEEKSEFKGYRKVKKK